MRLYIHGASLVLAAASLSACATITRGTTTAFTVESTPPAAAVKTSTGFTCPATPCTFKMPRKEGFSVTVSKAGYKPLTTDIVTKLSGGGAAGMAGNVLAGGIIGIGVDASSGALNDLSPNPLKVALDLEAAPPAVPSITPPADAAAAPVAMTASANGASQ